MGKRVQKSGGVEKEVFESTVISTFAGIGGSSLGYRMAGFRELLAIDFDDYCEEVFRLNFPDVPFWNKDITEVSGKEIMDFCKIGRGDLDVFDGSPPCQGFSTAGNRKVLDPRNNLFVDFVRLVDELRPKVFIMENVSGQVKGRMKGIFLEIMRRMKETGYNVKAKLMNAKYYGVPQSRERIFYIGVRPDVGGPVFPEPSKKIVAVKDVILNIKSNDLTGTNPPGYILKYLLLMKQGEGADKYHSNGSLFNSRRIRLNMPSNTVIKTAGLYHPVEDRLLSIMEVKRICSFPDNFELVGDFNKRWGGLGNAVMPLQMKAIAGALHDRVLKPYYDKIDRK
jgi:DNA (cytosine-5)-methyltransferase 1